MSLKEKLKSTQDSLNELRKEVNARENKTTDDLLIELIEEIKGLRWDLYWKLNPIVGPITVTPVVEPYNPWGDGTVDPNTIPGTIITSYCGEPIHSSYTMSNKGSMFADGVILYN